MNSREILMQIADVMKTKPEYMLAYTSSRAAARRMRDRGVTFMPICDQYGRVLGTITDRDLALRVVAEGLDCHIPITDVMTRELVACRAEDDVLHAARLMLTTGRPLLVVLDGGGRLAGLVSLSDVRSFIGDHGLSSEAG
jgi:CBS domain-containing protein